MSARGYISTWFVVLAVSGLVSSTAYGASPPMVNEPPAFASNVSQFGATLNGTVDPEGIPTSYHFVYGTSAAYGSLAPFPDQYVPVNEAEDTVTQVLGELQPGTTYHFALVANSPAGTVVGPDRTFTTPLVPVPAVVTGSANEVTVTAVTLSGSVDPQGFETSYFFEYGPSTAYGSRWPGTGVALGGLIGAQPVVSYVQNLQPGTLYHYRLVAINPGGTTYGGDATFTTPEYPASVIQEAPQLKGSFGINLERSSVSKANSKAKKPKPRRKSRARRNGRRRKKKR